MDDTSLIEQARVEENTPIARNIFLMRLKAPMAARVRPGQFVQVKVPGFFLRRPFSVCETNGQEELSLVYKVVGDGTSALSSFAAGQTLSLMGPLGNGFPVLAEDVLLIGGGVGVPPLVQTAKAYRAKGREVTALLGFNTADDIILQDRLQELGCQVRVATMDASAGFAGTALDLVRPGEEDRLVLSCGPMPMLRAVSSRFTRGYLSLEARMGCGFGVCMGCVVKTPDGGSRRVCADGPVFAIGEVVL